jgi:hypothetical protein
LNLGGSFVDLFPFVTPLVAVLGVPDPTAFQLSLAYESLQRTFEAESDVELRVSASSSIPFAAKATRPLVEEKRRANEATRHPNRWELSCQSLFLDAVGTKRDHL